jgi:hypothetical protein
VGWIRRPYELVVRDAEESPYLLGAVGDGVDQFLRRDFPLGGRLRDFLTVLVHPDQKVNLVAEEAVIACYGVGADFLESVTLVWVSGGIIDCAGEVVLGQLLVS